MNVVIFRENTEDVYAGIEWQSGTPEVKKLIEFLNNEMLKGGHEESPRDSGIGIKPISPTGTKRLVRRAIQHAIENKRASSPSCTRATSRSSPKAPSATGATNWPRDEFREQIVTERESWILDNKDKNRNAHRRAESPR